MNGILWDVKILGSNISKTIHPIAMKFYRGYLMGDRGVKY